MNSKHKPQTKPKYILVRLTRLYIYIIILPILVPSIYPSHILVVIYNGMWTIYVACIIMNM